MLPSSWLRSARLPGAVAWVGVERDESDATRFWSMVMNALRRSGAIPPDDPLATLAPAPIGGQEEFLQRLIHGLGRLSHTVLLVLDDLHHDQVADQEDAPSRAADGFVGAATATDGFEADLDQAELDIALDDLNNQADDFRAQGADVQHAFWEGYEDGMNGA
jgi:hypothetical protein